MSTLTTTVTEDEVKALYLASNEFNETMTWEDVKAAPHIYRLFENQVISKKEQRYKLPEEDRYQVTGVHPVKALGGNTCFLGRRPLRQVFNALQTARHILCQTEISREAKQDAYDELTRAAELLSKKSQPAKRSRHSSQQKELTPCN